MAYQKYKDIPNRREPLAGRDHIQHIENAVSPVVSRVERDAIGLARPNPGASRLLPPPRVMADPPTVTLESTSSVPSSRVTINAQATSVIRYFQADPIPEGSASYKTEGVTSGRLPITADLMFDGAIISFMFFGQRAKLRFRVDGELVTAGYSTSIPNDGASVHFVTLDFGSRANRHLQVEMTDSVIFRGVTINNKDTIYPSEFPIGPRIVIMGDSWSRDNSTVVDWGEVFGYVMGEALGWRDVRSVGVGGTGYLNAANYRSRMQTDIVDHNPDIVLVTGGINDSAFTEAELRTEAGLLYDAIRRDVPDAHLIVVEPFFPREPATADIIRTRSAVKAAAEARGLPYIRTDGWITGNGQVEAPTTSGNANYYITGNHPTRAGQAYLGRRLAAAVAAYLDSLV